MRLTELLSYNSVSKIGWTGVVEIFSPPPRRNHLRSQPAVYQLHLVQDLSFLRGKTISAVGTYNVGIWSQVVSEPQESSYQIAWNLAVCI